ncbi:hypothetical protein HJG60_008254 [Phyllostomus discolor]|uniref:Uncharacterized protein n=1 Tax=Phyllostomus discolor TaxID=89673 RepID=A0A834DQI0_9CHIR|nr:hypothetical protein HJG60_008254 [Phyllostomus discolor]
MNVNEEGVTLGRCLRAKGMAKETQLCHKILLQWKLWVGLKGEASISEMKGRRVEGHFGGAEEPYEQSLLESVLILMREDSWHLGLNGIQHLSRLFFSFLQMMTSFLWFDPEILENNRCHINITYRVRNNHI